MLVLVSSSRSPKLALSILNNQLVHFRLVYVENIILEDTIWSHLLCVTRSLACGPPPAYLLSQSENTTIMPLSITIIALLFIMGLSFLKAHAADRLIDTFSFESERSIVLSGCGTDQWMNSRT